jgi:hypothetical protein
MLVGLILIVGLPAGCSEVGTHDAGIGVTAERDPAASQSVSSQLSSANFQSEAESKMESSTPSSPIELGRVNWGRDLDVAKTRSRETGKPVLVLFQEVPG